MTIKESSTKYSELGDNTKIADFCSIHESAKIGKNVIIHPMVTIYEGVTIGDNVEIFPGTVIGKEPKGAGATARKITFNKSVQIGKDSSIGPNAVIYYDVEIGQNTLIGDGASLREKVKVGNFCILSRYVTINYNTIIGNNTRIMDLTHITGNCNIGNNVFISVHVSTVNDNVLVKREYDEATIKGPEIRDNSTIGAGAIILPGIIIGEGSMVGSGSIVTKNVDDFSLVIGAPARFVKKINN